MLARKALLIILTNVVGAVLGLASVVAIGRYMDPATFGMFYFALALAGIGSTLANLGYDDANIKRLSEGVPIATALGTYRVIKLVLVGGFVAIALLAAWIWERYVGFFDSTTFGIVSVAVVYFAIQQWRQVSQTTLQAFRLTANSQFMILIENLVKAPLVVTAALMYGIMNGRWNPYGLIPAEAVAWLRNLGPVDAETGALLLAVAWTAGMFASTGIGSMQMRRLGFRAGRFRRETARSYRRFALPTAVAASMYLIAKEVDTVMIGYFWSAQDVGYYGAAHRLTSVILIVPLAVRSLFFPIISELAAKHDIAKLNELSVRAQRALSLIMILASTLLAWYATEGIHVFLSDRFLPAAPILRLTAASMLIVAFTSVSTSIVRGMDRPRPVAVIGLGVTFLNVLLNTVLIPDELLGQPMLGLRGTGAAIATLIAQSAGLFAFAWVARQTTGGFHFSGATLKHAVAAASMVGVLWWAHDRVLGSVDRAWELVGAGLLGTVIYALLLMALRELSRRDLTLVKDSFHPGRLGAYVKHELRRGKDR